MVGRRSGDGTPMGARAPDDAPQRGGRGLLLL